MTRPRVISVGRKSDYPREVWGERDKADARLAEPLGQVSTAQPLHLMPGGFELNPKKSTTRDARGRVVDALLQRLGVR